MNLFKGVIALAALATLAIPHQPAQAYENPHKETIRLIQQLDIEVVLDHPECDGRYGFFGGVDGQPIFGLCADNIENEEQLYRTTRHEAIHVAQLCKAMGGAPQVVPGFALLNLEHNDYYMSRAQDNGWHILGYEEEDWKIEAEAFVLSNTWTAGLVNKALKTYCF